MAGTMRFVGEKPKVGETVFIAVDSANYPTGFWEGKLVSVGNDHARGSWEHDSAPCVAVITDERVKTHQREGYFERSPSVNYIVLDYELAIAELRERRDADQAEIRGLRKRIEIMTETYNSALRAIATPQGFEQFKDILEAFLKRLGK